MSASYGRSLHSAMMLSGERSNRRCIMAMTVQQMHPVAHLPLVLGVLRRLEVATVIDRLIPVVRKNWISVPCKGFLAFSHIAAWLTPPWTSALEVATISL